MLFVKWLMWVNALALHIFVVAVIHSVLNGSRGDVGLLGNLGESDAIIVSEVDEGIEIVKSKYVHELFNRVGVFFASLKFPYHFPIFDDKFEGSRWSM